MNGEVIFDVDESCARMIEWKKNETRGDGQTMDALYIMNITHKIIHSFFCHIQ
jgi:hypothetical protein